MTGPATPPNTTRPRSADADIAVAAAEAAIVAIGASAGGPDALRRLFARMPIDTDIVFIVACQSPSDGDASVADALRRVTRIPVVEVTETTALTPGHVYVVPSTRPVEVSPGSLRVLDPGDAVGRRVGIDLLFRAIAQVYGERCVAIVLSGNGAAGAVGLMRIKEGGGLTFVQRPSDARFDGMPRSAIETGIVDFVLPVDEMAHCLVDVLQSARSIRLPPAAFPMHSKPHRDISRRAEAALDDIKALLHDRTGHDFTQYKPATVIRRIERRLQVHSLHSLPDYRDFLAAHPEETAPLLQDLLISVTNFFRDRDAFEVLERAVLPELVGTLADRFAGRPTAARVLRVWAPGCATGEEVYSLAMLIAEALDRVADAPDFQIRATDIDERALAVGRAGRYPRSIVADVNLQRLRRHFTRDGDFYRVEAPLRERVVFSRHDVLVDPPFPEVDLICCRNLLIYVNRDAQRAILDSFRFSLAAGGFLFLGKTESTGVLPGAFEVVDEAARLYRSSQSASRSREPGIASGRKPASGPASDADGAPADEQTHRQALAMFGPTSVLIDGSRQVLHLSAGAADPFVHNGAAASQPLMSVVRSELRPALRAALDEANRSDRSVEAAWVPLQRNGRRVFVTIAVRPLAGRVTTHGRTLVVFDEIEGTLASADGVVGHQRADAVADRVDAEVDRQTRHLQRRLDRSESSAEALMASNEALQAQNDVLRASAETDSDHEELQSFNEELVTVSRELKDRIEATTRINDDLQELIDSSEIATIFIDESLRIRRFTPRARDIFHLIPSDRGRPLRDLRNRLRYEALDDDVAEAFRTIKLIEREVDGEGGTRYLARVLPHRTGLDHAEGATITFVDITRLRSERDRLHHREAHLRLAAETTFDFAIMTMDFDGVVTAWNAGAERMFGYPAAEIVGRSADVLFTPEDRAAGVPQHEVSTARALGRAEDDRWHLRKDHSRFFCSGVVTRYESADGHGLAKIARDITGMRREQITRDAMLIEARTARTAYEASSRLKDEFLAVMSHELKHPLNLIHVNAELLERMPLVREHPSASRAAQMIRRTVVGQGKIIDDLLDLSRVRTGKLALAIEPVDLAPLVDRIVSSAGTDARDKDIALRLQVDPDLGKAACDPVRVEQIAWNLLSNALKFTPAGGRIDVRLQRDGAAARLSVQDSGRGIDPSFLPKVFDMFGQDQTAASRREGGMGIGLALVSELALAQGGRVEAQSDGPGRGALFTVWLPLQTARATDSDGDERAGRSLVGLRILVVEDSPEALEPFLELLRLEGATPVAALDGRAAVERLDEGDYDLLISDVAMPDMGGYALMAEVRRHPRAAGITAIALTGYGRSRDKQKSAEAGFDAHVTKPASIADLRRALERVAREREG